MDKKKTLYLCPNGYIGGAEKAMIHFCYGHKKNRWPVEILFFSDGPAVEYAKSYGIITHCLPFRFRLSQPGSLLKTAIFIRKLLMKNEFKVIHATMAYSQIISFLSSMFLPIKRVWYQHGPVGGLLDKIASCTPVDQIYFNSRYLQYQHNASNILKFHYFDQYIIPCAVENRPTNSDNIKKIKEKYGNNGLLFLLTGRICSWKGYETAIKALSKLQLYPWHLLIIGSAFRESDKKYEQSLHCLVDQLNLNKRMTFLPFQENIQDYFSAADIFLHTSNVPEPFGLVVAEAMLQETLVIGSSQGGVAEILDNGVTGFSFDSTSADAINQLKNILEQIFTYPPSDLKKIAQAGKKNITDRHDIITNAKKLEILYSR